MLVISFARHPDVDNTDVCLNSVTFYLEAPLVGGWLCERLSSNQGQNEEGEPEVQQGLCRCYTHLMFSDTPER